MEAQHRRTGCRYQASPHNTKMNTHEKLFTPNGKFMDIAKPLTVSYEPKEDITAWELARLIPLFSPNQYITEDTLIGLGLAARHLKRH
jgi:hypothetical protein